MSDDPISTTAQPGPPTSPTDDGVPTRIALLAAIGAAALALLLVVAAMLPRADDAGATTSPSAVGTTASTPFESPSGTTTTSPDATASPATSSSPVVTASAPVAVLVGAGDIGDCSTDDDSATASLLDDIPGTVFTAGDNAYENGTPKQYATCYDETWGRHKTRTRPAPGNHDWRTERLAGYFGYFGAAARGPDGRSWYSYDLGTWHVIVLDSECDRVGGCGSGSEQGRWLAADLDASSATCTVAIWHKPRFSSGEHGNDASVAPFWTALHAAAVDVVVNGHDHDYERFAPQDPDGTEDPLTGIRQFVAGTGGTALRPFAETVANSERRDARTHGVFKLTLHEASFDWEFIPASGDFSDEGTAPCH